MVEVVVTIKLVGVASGRSGDDNNGGGCGGCSMVAAVGAAVMKAVEEVVLDGGCGGSTITSVSFLNTTGAGE